MNNSSTIDYGNAPGRISKKRRFLSVTGFTLIEMMIVVAIVIILITLTAPSILRSRIATNEALALASLKIINDACQSYHASRGSYPEDLSKLIAPESDPPYIDTLLASGQKQGYQFIYNRQDADQFTIQANPLSTGLLKGRYFYMDATGITRFRSDGPAGPDDEIIK